MRVFPSELIRFAAMTHPAHPILARPWRFALQVLKGFRDSQGILLSGAVAYYTLLSLIPLFTFMLLVLSHLVDQERLLATLTGYVALLVPGEAKPVAEQARHLLAHRSAAGWFLVAALLSFASLAFATLERAMKVIFHHRTAARQRNFLESALIPYLYIVLLGIGLLLTTLITSVLQAIGTHHVALVGREFTLNHLLLILIYLVGLGGEIAMLTAIYTVMPVGRVRLRHAFLGGVTAGLLWELTRHLLVWYFATMSLVGLVYGSFATTIVALFTLEAAAVILLLGAQVIAEYERIVGQPAATPSR